MPPNQLACEMSTIPSVDWMRCLYDSGIGLMSEILSIIISRSAPAIVTPAPNATRIAIRMPNSTKATNTDSSVKVVRTLRRSRLRQTSGKNFMRPPP